MQGPSAGKTRAVINVTPLIDVLLVLLIIFMVITPLQSQGLPALVPQQADANAPPAPVEPIVVTVTKDKTLELNGRKIEVEDLEGTLHKLLNRRNDPVVFVSGDRSLDFGEIARTVDLVRGTGVAKVALLPSDLQ